MYKVLIIDDDPAMTELLTLLLKTHGLDAYMANSGEDGLKMIHKVSPDVVILDLMMPEMDGFAVIDALKMDQETAHIPVIVATAKELTADEKTRLGTQIQTLMQKGDFLNDEFLKEVIALIK